jgi:hypothetical protein
VQQKNKFFGFIEDCFYEQAKAMNLKCVILANEYDDMIDAANMGLGGQDALYLQWQSDSALKNTEHSFEEYLKIKLNMN